MTLLYVFARQITTLYVIVLISKINCGQSYYVACEKTGSENSIVIMFN